MRHFFLVPKIDITESCKNLFKIIEEENITKEDLQTKLFSQEDYKNQNGSEEISGTTIYKWKNGINLPDIYKLIKLTILLKKPVEDIFFFNFSFKETKVKVKSIYKSGTDVHLGHFSFHFTEEDLSIDELEQKYKEDFAQIYWYNSTFENYYSNYFYYFDIDNLIPNIDKDICKHNFSMFLKKCEKEYGKINKILIDLLDITTSATITNWKNEQTLPETEMLLTVLRFFNTSFESLWSPVFSLTNNFKFSKKTRIMYEKFFLQIFNRDQHLNSYCKLFENTMKSYTNKYPDFHFLFLDYEKKTLETLIAENFKITKNKISFKNDYLFILESSSDFFDYEAYEESDWIVLTINNSCENLYRYIIYRIVKEDKIDKHYGIILKCFESFLRKDYSD